MQQNCVSSRREERSKRRILAQFLLHMQKLPQQQQVNQVGQHEYQHPQRYRTKYRYCNQTEFEFFTISSFPLSLWRQCSAAKGMGRGLFQPISVTHWPRSSLACSLLDSDRIHWKLLLHIALVQTCPTSFPGPLPWYLERSWEQGILDGIYFQYNSSEKTFFSLRWNLLQGVLWSSVWPQRLRIWRRSWRLNSNTVEDFKARRLHFFFWI